MPQSPDHRACQCERLDIELHVSLFFDPSYRKRRAWRLEPPLRDAIWAYRAGEIARLATYRHQLTAFRQSPPKKRLGLSQPGCGKGTLLARRRDA